MTPSGGSNTLPRATCPACGKDVALRRGGQLREHRASPEQIALAEPGELRFSKCPASGYSPATVSEALDAELKLLRKAAQEGIA